MNFFPRTRLLIHLLGGGLLLSAGAADYQLRSPDGRLAIYISDSAGLRYQVECYGHLILQPSQLGLEFQDGTRLGPAARVTKTTTVRHDRTWENPLGQRRLVRDHWRELRLSLVETNGLRTRQFDLMVRAYDDGVAFRYDLPEASGLGHFVLTRELTEFHFAEDYRCWAGEESVCAENHYPELTLSTLPAMNAAGHRYESVLPLLVAAPGCYVAVAESDLLDWAGLFVTGTGSPVVAATLAPRSDHNGLVVSAVPCQSPWRVLLIGRQPGDLISSDLIVNLATPSRLSDTSWVKPGVSAWDAWWTGVNPSLPQYTGVGARGDTRSHEEYVDFAAEMGWPYQLVDWYWYRDDPTKWLPHVDLPAVFAHARDKQVRLFIWMHSKDLKKVGFEKAFATVAGWGAAGVKVDFMNSDSQETVEWYAAALAAAAQYHLMVDFHGAYKPTGLARTYPNFITQEGVLGNEYNKLPGAKCTPLHTITLPFTRGLLGPMDFTPGGFLNRAPADFKVTYPAEVMGSRARQMAMTIVYLSPLLVLCDSPANYRGQPGIEFFRGLPTVWDDTVVPEAEVGRSLVIARRSGDRWYLAAMNGEAAATLQVPLSFLGRGHWSLRSFADNPGGTNYAAIVESRKNVDRHATVSVTLLPAGGFAAVLSRGAVKPGE